MKLAIKIWTTHKRSGLPKTKHTVTFSHEISESYDKQFGLIVSSLEKILNELKTKTMVKKNEN